MPNRTPDEGWRLAEAMGRLLEAPDIAALHTVLLEVCREAMGATRGFAAVVDRERERLEIVARSGDELPRVLALEWPPVHAALHGKDARPYALDADAGDPEAGVRGARRLYFIPLRPPRAATSVICLAAEHAEAFTAPPETWLAQVCHAATLLLARGLVQAEREEELLLLWDVKRRLAEDADEVGRLDEANLSEMLSKLLRVALRRTRTGNGGIFLLDEETGELLIEQEAIRGDHPERLPERFRRQRGDKHSGITFQVIEHNRPYRTGDVAFDPYYMPFFQSIRSNLTVPISFQGRAIGAIAVESVEPDAFSDSDELALVDLARTATMFIRRAQLYRATLTAQRGPAGRGILIRGISPEWVEVETRVERAASTEATVLLRGESGTGKELVAHAIHFNSPRAKAPFVAVNSGAIPEALLESELFGHVRGAFTDATRDKVGYFEQANRGTIFLDEIGDLPIALQVKLLRALENGEIQRVGDTVGRRADVRVIAATHRDLEAMVRAGTFRADLYFRLAVVPILLPPLRRYRDSIPGIAQGLLEELARQHKRPTPTLSRDALAMLLAHDWPGNVRELRNCLEQALVLEDGTEIRASRLPEELRRAVRGRGREPRDAALPRDYHDARADAVRQFERGYVDALLAGFDGNMSRAAERAGLSRVNLYRLLARHGIAPRTRRG